MSDPLPILHFSDILCVWAYAADIRVRELERQFSGQIEITCHFIHVYGDVRRRIADSGLGAEGYSQKIRGVAARFDHVRVHEEIFRTRPPTSSMPCHIFLRAVSLLGPEDVADCSVGGGDPRKVLALAVSGLRQAFFQDLVDVSAHSEQLALAERLGLPVGLIEGHLASGRAHAEHAHDLQLQKRFDVSLSPTLVLNEGRQRLNGNVGYRVLEANVRELLRQPAEGFSWC